MKDSEGLAKPVFWRCQIPNDQKLLQDVDKTPNRYGTQAIIFSMLSGRGQAEMGGRSFG